MSKDTDYSPEEWKTVSAAPFLAGMLITVSDLSGPIGTAKEAYAIVSGVIDSAANSSSELIKSVADGLKAKGRPDLPDLPSDKASIRTALIDTCKRAVDIVSTKSPTEAEEYRQWLTSLAQKTAEASKEGGFLGIGGVPVSEDEKAAVKALAAALGGKA